MPEPWLLGSSEQSALWAGELGLRYAFADFINPRGAPIAETYRRGFAPASGSPSRGSRSPCGRSSPRPRRRRSGSRRAGGWPSTCCAAAARSPVPPPEKARALLRAARESARLGGPSAAASTGTPAQVRAEIEEIAAAYGAEEAIVVTITHDHEARRRSYELLAEEFGLEASGEPGLLSRPAGA